MGPGKSLSFQKSLLYLYCIYFLFKHYRQGGKDYEFILFNNSFLSYNSHERRMLSFSFSLFVDQAVLMLVTKSPTFCFVDFFLSKYTASSSPVLSDKGCSSCHLCPWTEGIVGEPPQIVYSHPVHSSVSSYHSCTLALGGHQGGGGCVKQCRKRCSSNPSFSVKNSEHLVSKEAGKETLPWADSAVFEGKSKPIPNLPRLREKRKGRSIMAGKRVTVSPVWKVGQEAQQGFLRGEEGWLRRCPSCPWLQSEGCKARTLPTAGETAPSSSLFCKGD